MTILTGHQVEVCEGCGDEYPAGALIVGEYFHSYEAVICRQCQDDFWEADAAEMEAIAKAERYNEEVLAGMHAPEDYGDYMDRIAMLYDPAFN